MCSLGAALAGVTRGNRLNENDDSDYQVVLPQLPTGRVALNTVFLHGDIRARPYKVEDFRDALRPTGLLPEVVALGAYQINHVWAVTMCGADATMRLQAIKELQVKGRRCLIIDPQDRTVKLRLHWLLHGVEDEDVKTAFAAFGKVLEVSRERWRVEGVSDKGSTTRSVLLNFKSGVTVDDLPHQIRVAGELALVVAPGRPMQCLRCKGNGHVRRDCKVPRCSLCKRFGHTDAKCERSYAAAVGQAESDKAAEQTMDVVEAEDAAKGTGDAANLQEVTPTVALDAEEEHVTPKPATKSTTPATDEKEVAKEDYLPQVAVVGVPTACQDHTAFGATQTPVAGAAVKRPLEKEEDLNGTTEASKTDGPPAKAPLGRRSRYKPMSNVATERQIGDKPASQQNDTGQPGKHGDV